MSADRNFETFAKRLCEYCMKNFVVPYLQKHGNVQSYRATVKSVDPVAKTMEIKRPFDTAITIPYNFGASYLQAGDYCTVFVLGESSNAIVVADSQLNAAPMKTSQLTNDSGFTTKNIWYATCTTGAGTAAKVATTNTGDFVLSTGNMVRVKFTNGNSYNGTATLNVDSKGAVDLCRVGTTKTTRYYWTAGEVVDFVYDGTNFVMSAKGTATTTYYGLVKLTTSATSTSTSLVTTASCVDAKIAAKVPAAPATAGTYTLTCTVDSGGTATYSWT